MYRGIDPLVVPCRARSRALDPDAPKSPGFTACYLSISSCRRRTHKQPSTSGFVGGFYLENAIRDARFAASWARVECMRRPAQGSRIGADVCRDMFPPLPSRSSAAGGAARPRAAARPALPHGYGYYAMRAARDSDMSALDHIPPPEPARGARPPRTLPNFHFWQVSLGPIGFCSWG